MREHTIQLDKEIAKNFTKNKFDTNKRKRRKWKMKIPAKVIRKVNDSDSKL
jgi:hypothetical protein